MDRLLQYAGEYKLLSLKIQSEGEFGERGAGHKGSSRETDLSGLVVQI